MFLKSKRTDYKINQFLSEASDTLFYNETVQ